MIIKFFNKTRLIQVLTDKTEQQDIMGFFHWSIYNQGDRADITFMTIKNTYSDQAQFIFTEMLKVFSRHFPNVHVLTSSVTPDTHADAIFIKAGWKKNELTFLRNEKPTKNNYFTIIKPCAPERKNISHYTHMIGITLNNNKQIYFELDLDLTDEPLLKTPIIVENFNYTNKISLYYKNTLIIQATATKIFTPIPVYCPAHNLLILTQFELTPLAHDALDKKNFFEEDDESTESLSPQDYKNNKNPANHSLFFSDAPCNTQPKKRKPKNMGKHILQHHEKKQKNLTASQNRFGFKKIN